ncbi:MAG: trypsin-like peptidase domain-containing protein [Clostridia bacterium]|nr:trypsin-like peptidase domain-containing protein [Clostridia bacterium]
MENNENEFSYISNTGFKKAKPIKKPSSFGKNIIVSFISGALGASLVIGSCFCIPSIKTKLIGNTSKPTAISTSTGTTYTNTLIDLSDYSNTAVSVAQKVLPSVVGITVTYSINSFWGESSGEATGSGIIISEDGYIVTNNHVIANESSSYYQITEATGIKIHLYGDEAEYEAKVVGSDSYSDLAVLKIEKEGLPAATIGNSDAVLVGEFVMAIGNPLGMDSSVTCGVVSATNRELTDTDGKSYITIQTDAAINSGNSGGALVNAKGEVIGINTLKLSGSGIEGMGFSIPINSTTKIINQLTEKGEVIRPYIGITGSSVTDSVSEVVRKQYELPEGIYVNSVEKDSPAEKAGIQQGDIITAIEGKEVKSVSELNNIKNTYEVGTEVTLKITRKKEAMDVKVTLEAPKKVEESENKTTIKQQYNNQDIFDLFR